MEKTRRHKKSAIYEREKAKERERERDKGEDKEETIPVHPDFQLKRHFVFQLFGRTNPVSCSPSPSSSSSLCRDEFVLARLGDEKREKKFNPSS